MQQHVVGAVEAEQQPTPGSRGRRANGATRPGSVVVRRHAGLAALVGASASGMAIAFLWRASQTMAVLDWVLCGAMALLALHHLSALLDARTPLLVADDLGVRIRLGDQWRGLPWEAIAQVAVRPRRGPLRDGRLVVVPHSLSRALEGLDGRARRHVLANQRMYRAPLAVPLGATTRVATSPGGGIAADVAALSGGLVEVVEPRSTSTDVPEPAPAPERGADRERRKADAGDRPAGRPGDVDGPAGDAGVPESGTPADDPADPAPEPARTVFPAAPVALRPTRPGLRAEATLDSFPTAGSSALHPRHDPDPAAVPPEGRELRRPGSVDLVFEPVSVEDRVRPISTPGEPVEPLVVDDFVTEPAYEPVIGPELAAARTRLGLSVDDLADRTRIRPHVIESIEVDDFAPCGGDFYARGHLRTLARILGKDPRPLLSTFEERYATAPVNARRVFEAELATGMTGSMRSTVGGPSWGLLVAAVLSLVLVWGVVRLATDEPTGTLEVPAPVLDGSAGVGKGYPDGFPPAAGGAPAEPVTVRLTTTGPDSAVVVRDGTGAVVFRGEMVPGERKTLQVSPPVRVRAADGGAVEARVDGRDRGPLGEPGQPVRRTFGLR